MARDEGATMLKVTQVRSQIGTKPKTRGTLRALGLRRLGDSNVLPDRPEIRGMLHRVPHLVTVETVQDKSDGEPQSRRSCAKRTAKPKEAGAKSTATPKEARREEHRRADEPARRDEPEGRGLTCASTS